MADHANEHDPSSQNGADDHTPHPPDQPHNPPDTRPAQPQQSPRARGVLDPLLSDAPDGLLWSLGAADEHPNEGSGVIDRWAHRRGEPRLFALLWSSYLFAAAITTIMRVPMLGITEARFVQASSRLLLLLIVVGLVVLWPLARLSQASPRRPVAATLIDLCVLLLPLQAVVWPLTWLGRWSWNITAGVSLTLASWTALVGVCVAMGTAIRAGLGRAVWMAIALLLVGAAPTGAFVMARAGAPIPQDLALASPLTAVYAITTGPSGLSPSMTPTMWLMAALPAAIALPAWLAAAAALRAHARTG